MNVLILSAAAKVLLVRAFREAAGACGGRVIAADVTPDNAALFEADEPLILPRSDAPDFPEAVVAACHAHSVRLVVPTRDAELETLALLKPRLADHEVTVLVASPEAIAICRDKRRFAAFCAAQGLETPRAYAPGEAPDRYPVFVRPVSGAGGAQARRIDRAEDLPDDPGLLVQVFDAAPEFTIDVLLDLEGRPLQAVARQRLSIRAGEAVKSRVVAAPELTNPAMRLCAALGLVGHNVVQAFWEPGAPPRFIEINPRFGGASNLSIQAGLASPERILMMLTGSQKAATPRPIRYGLTMLRYAEDRIVTAAELAELDARSGS